MVELEKNGLSHRDLRPEKIFIDVDYDIYSI